MDIMAKKVVNMSELGMLLFLNFVIYIDSSMHQLHLEIPGGRLNVTMLFYHHKYKTVTVSSLKWKFPYLEKRSLYWDGARGASQ